MNTTNIPPVRDAHKTCDASEKHPPDATKSSAEEPREAEREPDAGGMHSEIDLASSPRQPREIRPREKQAYDLFDELWAEWVDSAEETASTTFGFHCSTADSDLERVFLAALMFIRPAYVQTGYGGALDLKTGVELSPQHRCGPYRIDFAVIVPAMGEFGRDIRIAVECDGHYFHDRRAKDAERDKRRDRYLTLNGWRVMRFSEAEVIRAPRDCATQVEEVIESLLEEQFVAAGEIVGRGE
jgi:very-short-patch-repair endonuclease